ncbi:MAG TPA: M20/M25/M40 family metallo-hydrolase, partial [Solirubrobacteraceae bacterium]|nr:M20/M25/M40 family metallo-hydrolase [Solirubrobacteraceae bacterium]
CRASLDIRHAEREPLEALDAHVTALLDEARVAADWEVVYREDPVDFDPGLVATALQVAGGTQALRSGPLHDSAALARAGVPTVMLFAPSIAAISHARTEDTAEGDLLAAIDALARLAGRLLTAS